MILDLTRSHCTSHEIPGFWVLLLATSETDEDLFFPLGIYYIWSSCLQMKIFWLLQPKGNVHLSPPQDLDTRPKFQLRGQWGQEWYINIRMIAVMQKHDEFLEQRKKNSEKSKTKIREEFKREIQRCLTKDSEEEPKCLQNGREKVLEAWITNIAFQSLCTHTEIAGEGEGDTESQHFSSLLPACGFFSQTFQTSSSFSPVAW